MTSTIDLDPADLLAVADEVLNMGRPGEEIEVGLGCESDTEIRAYDGEIEALSSASTAAAFVRVIVDGRQGTASATSLQLDDLAELVAEARDNARFSSPDPLLRLAEPDGVAQPPLEFFDEQLFELSVDDKRELALDLERRVLAGDERMVGLDGGADYFESFGVGALASTAGIRVAERETSCGLSVYAMAADGDEVQVGFGASIGRAPHQLDIARCADEATRRATRLLGAAKPATQRLPVVFDPWVTAQFLGLIAEMLSGEGALKGRTPFVGRLGESIGPTGLTIVDDPTNPLALGASLTDDEGLATRRVPMITDGVLEGFLHNSYTGAAFGASSTGSATRGGGGRPSVGARAVSLIPGSHSAAEICAEVGNGVLIQEVIGLHSGVNPVSGDFSTGVEGVMIRNGQLAEPIREAIVASTLQRMLASITLIGADLEYFPLDASGTTVAFEELTLSGS